MGSIMEDENATRNDQGIEFWNMNMPKHLHTKECPPFLQYAAHPSQKRDRDSLFTLDADYHKLNWQEVLHLLNSGQLDTFQRVPSELRRYREWMWGVAKAEGDGGIQAYLMRERLHWTAAAVKQYVDREPDFEDESSYRILRNDWPYGVDDRIVHLIVWTKANFPKAIPSADVPEGDLDNAGRAQIQEFVDSRFGSRCGHDNVTWFRNWAALKSIDTVEHFHVMLFDADPAFIDEVTHGDVPTAERVRSGEL